MLKGPSIALYREILGAFPELTLVASGGVSGIEDIYNLEEAKVPAVIFGKALYEGRISLRDIEHFIIR